MLSTANAVIDSLLLQGGTSDGQVFISSSTSPGSNAPAMRLDPTRNDSTSPGLRFHYSLIIGPIGACRGTFARTSRHIRCVPTSNLIVNSVLLSRRSVAIVAEVRSRMLPCLLPKTLRRRSPGYCTFCRSNSFPTTLRHNWLAHIWITSLGPCTLLPLISSPFLIFTVVARSAI